MYAPTQRQLWDHLSCLEPKGHEQYPALSLSSQSAITLMAPNSLGSALLRSFVCWQVGKGGVSLFRCYSSPPLPLFNMWLVFVGKKKTTNLHPQAG